MNSSVHGVLAGSLLLALLSACGKEPTPPSVAATEAADPARNSGPLVVQSSRPPQQMIPVLDGWRSETGGRFELAADEDDEGPTQADIIIFGSVAETWDVAESDQLRPVFSEVVDANIDARLRDEESRWVGLSRRGRVVVYNPESVSADELTMIKDYESLRGETWQGRLCLSSSSVGGNRLLVALLISRHEIREAELIVREWRTNLAAPVLADDSDLLDAIADGSCSIGLADSNDAQAAGVGIHWFDKPGSTLVDVTTAGVSRHAADPERAANFLEWLTTELPNALFAIQDLEIPANATSPAGNIVADYGSVLSEPQSLSDLGFLIEEADRLIERARYP